MLPGRLGFQGADSFDDGGEVVQVGLVDGVVGEAVPVTVAEDLLGHLLDRPDEQERGFQDFPGGEGAAVLLRQTGRGLVPVAGHQHSLGERVPFDVAGPVPGPFAGKPHAVAGFGCGAHPEHPRGLALDLEQAADFYEEELDYRIRTMTSLIEPVMTVAVGLVVGFIAVSLISAMYGLVGAIK